MKRARNNPELRTVLSAKLSGLNDEIDRLAVRALTNDTASNARDLYKDRLAEQLNLIELIFGAKEVERIIKIAGI